MQQTFINPNERTQLIEIPIYNTGVTEFSLGSLPDLRTAQRIIRIEALPASQVPFTPSGKANVNDTVFKKSFLRLINGDNTEYKALSLFSLSKSVNGTVIPMLNTPMIDPEKSKIVIGNTTGLVLNEAFLLEVTFEKGKL